MLAAQLAKLEEESTGLSEVLLYIASETMELEKRKNILEKQLEKETAKLDNIETQQQLDESTETINGIQDHMDTLFKMQKELADKAPELQATMNQINDMKKLVQS